MLITLNAVTPVARLCTFAAALALVIARPASAEDDGCSIRVMPNFDRGGLSIGLTIALERSIQNRIDALASRLRDGETKTVMVYIRRDDASGLYAFDPSRDFVELPAESLAPPPGRDKNASFLLRVTRAAAGGVSCTQTPEIILERASPPASEEMVMRANPTPPEPETRLRDALDDYPKTIDDLIEPPILEMTVEVPGPSGDEGGGVMGRPFAPDPAHHGSPGSEGLGGIGTPGRSALPGVYFQDVDPDTGAIHSDSRDGSWLPAGGGDGGGSMNGPHSPNIEDEADRVDGIHE